MRTSIYYLCYSSALLAPLGILLAVLASEPFWQVAGASLALAAILTAYAFFIERHWLRTAHIDLNKGWDMRVVVISDQHLGVYKGAKYMEQVVARINALENIEAVLLAGDLTYFPQDLEREHAPLADIIHPTYAVLGNHDVVQSGYISHAADLHPLMERLGVQIIEGASIQTESGLHITGLGSHIAEMDDVSVLETLDTTERHLILAHNPDSTRQSYPAVDLSDSVTVSGHTHGGQIRIPGLYRLVIPTRGSFHHRGPYDLSHKGTLVITHGLGEVGLPLRLFCRPEILVLDL